MLPVTSPELRRSPRAQSASIETGYSWWVAAITLVMGSLSFGAVTSIPVLLKPLAQSMGTGASEIAFVHMSTLCGAGLGALFLGRLQDYFGFFPVALVAAVTSATGLWAASYAHSPLELCIIYGVLVGGIGQGALFTPLTAAVSLWFDTHRPLAIALAACGQCVGGLLLPPWLRWSAEQFGWRDTLQMYGVVCGAVLLACAFAFRRKPPVQHPLQGTVERTTSPIAPSRAGVAMLALSLASFNFSTFIVVGHLTAFGEEQGYSPMVSASLMSALLGVSLVSRLMVGQAGTRWGNLLVLSIVSTFLVAGTTLLWYSASRVAIWSATVLIGLGFGGYVPMYSVLIRELFPSREAGRRLAEIFFMAFISAGIASWTGGLLRDVTGHYSAAFALATIFAAAGFLLLLHARFHLETH